MNHLKDWLTAKNMTQQELADRLGMTREAVNRNVNAEQPSNSFMWKFTRQFGINEAIAAFDGDKEQAQ